MAYQVQVLVRVPVAQGEPEKREYRPLQTSDRRIYEFPTSGEAEECGRMCYGDQPVGTYRIVEV